MIRSVLQFWSDLQRGSGIRIAIGAAIGVLGMVLGVLLQTTQWFEQLPGETQRLRIASVKLSDHPGWVQIGHLAYTVLATQMQQVSHPKNPDEPSFLARVDVRIADVQGTSDYIDNETFHLVIDGKALSHTNNVNLTVYEKSATQTELVFELPEAVSSAELLIGKPSEGMARIPLEFIGRRMADGS